MIFAFKNNRKQGFSLLELLLVVAVGAVLILSGLTAYRLVVTNAATKESKSDLLRIQSQVRRIYTEEVYTGISTSDVGLTAAFEGMKREGTTVMNAYGSPIILKSDASNTFKIIYEGVPRSGCADLIGIFQNDNNFTRGVGANDGDNVTLAPKDITISAATALCTQEKNRIVWEFF